MADRMSARAGRLVLLLGLLLPAAGRAQSGSCSCGDQGGGLGCCGMYYSRLAYWTPTLYRWLERHRPTNVSVYPPPEAYAPILVPGCAAPAAPASAPAAPTPAPEQAPEKIGPPVEIK